MQNIKKVLQAQYEQEIKMMKEIAFFLEQEEFLCKIDTDKKFSLFVDTGHYEGNLVFRIETNKTQTKYILHAMFYSKGKTESVDKIERKLPQTIMKHINRIIKNLPEIFEAREEYEDYVDRKYEEHKQKLREEIIAELKREQEAVKKTPAKKRTRKTTKKTESKVSMAHELSEISENPRDIVNDPYPDF